MTHLIFVRHGQDQDNANNILNGHRESPLTDFGRQQVRMTARRLSILKPDVIYTSTLKRTTETAEILAELLGVRRVISERALIERDFGVLTGAPYTDIPRLSRKMMTAHGFQVFLEADGVESHDQVVARLRPVLERILSEHAGQRVLVVTHGDVYKAAVMLFDGLSLEDSLHAPWLDNAEVADFGLRSTLER